MPNESEPASASPPIVNILKQRETLASVSGEQLVSVSGAVKPIDRARSAFGGYLIWAFIAGLAFFGIMIAAEVALVAVNREVFLEVDDVVKVATTFGSIIGPPLGFVISYFFKEREER